MSGLFGSSIIELALGLFLLYWLLSIICSSVWEMFAALFKLRAVDLEQGIANLVCDPKVFLDVMSHPAVAAVGNTDAETVLIRRLSGGVAGRPSNLSARSFSLAFLDAIAPVEANANVVQAVRSRATELAGVPNMAAGTLPEPGYQPIAPVAPGGVGLGEGAALVKVQNRLLRELCRQLNATPASKLKTDVEQIANRTGADVAEALREALKAPSWHPIRRAAIETINASAGKELYAWAYTMPENDRLRRAMLSSVEGKQRLGRFLLNITDRELATADKSQLFDKLYVVSKGLPKGDAREAFEEALHVGEIERIREVAKTRLPIPVALRVAGVLDDAQPTVSALRGKIESWFDESMRHVTGVYKRRAKTWIFVIGLIVTVLIGADSIRFATNLYANPALRDVLVHEAERTVGTSTANAANSAGGATSQSNGGSEAQTSGRMTTTQAATELGTVSQLFGFADHPLNAPLDAPQDWALFVVSRLVGCVLTAFAVSLGAPFWFDVLGKIADLRSTGQSAPSSSSKDSQSSSAPDLAAQQS